ncbi:MAG: hypothetical protein ACOCZ9_03955, partial [Spirochaetota bacterium]
DDGTDGDDGTDSGDGTDDGELAEEIEIVESAIGGGVVAQESDAEETNSEPEPAPTGAMHLAVKPADDLDLGNVVEYQLQDPEGEVVVPGSDADYDYEPALIEDNMASATGLSESYDILESYGIQESDSVDYSLTVRSLEDDDTVVAETSGTLTFTSEAESDINEMGSAFYEDNVKVTPTEATLDDADTTISWTATELDDQGPESWSDEGYFVEVSWGDGLSSGNSDDVETAHVFTSDTEVSYEELTGQDDIALEDEPLFLDVNAYPEEQINYDEQRLSVTGDDLRVARLEYDQNVVE